MCVVNKIDSLGYTFEICNKQARIYDKDLTGFQRKRLFPNVGESNLDATYKTVVEFIKWIVKPEES